MADAAPDPTLHPADGDGTRYGTAPADPDATGCKPAPTPPPDADGTRYGAAPNDPDATGFKPAPAESADPDGTRYRSAPADADATGYTPTASHSYRPEGGRALPCRFGDYELLEEMARGGMGVVYRARRRR